MLETWKYEANLFGLPSWWPSRHTKWHRIASHSALSPPWIRTRWSGRELAASLFGHGCGWLLEKGLKRWWINVDNRCHSVFYRSSSKLSHRITEVLSGAGGCWWLPRFPMVSLCFASLATQGAPRIWGPGDPLLAAWRDSRWQAPDPESRESESKIQPNLCFKKYTHTEI